MDPAIAQLLRILELALKEPGQLSEHVTAFLGAYWELSDERLPNGTPLLDALHDPGMIGRTTSRRMILSTSLRCYTTVRCWRARLGCLRSHAARHELNRRVPCRNLRRTEGGVIGFSGMALCDSAAQ